MRRGRSWRKVASEDKGATPPLGERALLTGRAAFGTPPLPRGLRFGRSYAVGCFLCTLRWTVHKKHNAHRGTITLPAVLALWAGAMQHFGASCTSP